MGYEISIECGYVCIRTETGRFEWSSELIDISNVSLDEIINAIKNSGLVK